jgi:Peptidase family M28
LRTVDYNGLMRILSRPRPSGSDAERETVRTLQDWLTSRGLPCRLQPFPLYPYFFICIGLWMILAHTLLAVSVWLQWGWMTTVIAVLGILGGLIDTAFDLPLVTWFGKTTGQNILIEFGVPTPKRELVISAHYDSKTELFDHYVRTFFVRNLRFGIALAVLLGILSPLQKYLSTQWADAIHIVGIVLTIPLLFLVWGLGLNLSLGRLRRDPSQGAVDNGAACAILLGLAQQVADGAVPLEDTQLTLALFGGEEVNMQGSRAYALGREWTLPAAALNLEIMAQDGDYVFWEQDGMSLKLFPTDTRLNHAVSLAVEKVTGKLARAAGPINSDGYSFLRARIPVAVLGTFDRQQGERGFHLPTDNLDRVQMNRLAEGVEILAQLIRDWR